MKIFEEMKASLMAQAPFAEEPELVTDAPNQPGDRVTYRIPQPDSNMVCPEWVEHRGIVLQVDPVGQMVLIRPEDEPGTPWRWVAWCYTKKANDGEA